MKAIANSNKTIAMCPQDKWNTRDAL